MKGSRSLLMIGVSCVAALAAVVFASQWMNQQASLNTKKVVVVSSDVNLGTRLTPELLRLADWPADSVPAGSFSDIKSLDTRVTRLALQRGEPVAESKLAQIGATGGLSAVVAEGKRAMTVRVNDVIGVAGFALPGNYVDILVSTQDDPAKLDRREQGRDLNISKLVLERILVLAVAQEASQNDTKPKVVNAVTLEVTPEQAEKLDLARSVGQLSLVLRNQIDLKPAETEGATKETLLAPSSVKPASVRQEPAPKATPVAHKTPAKSSGKSPNHLPRKDDCYQVITGAGRVTQCY